ncbi:MAG: ABC transporter transmembrane domain-containing protein, partial [Anaerolineae bacterium]|nr:ABC transporter transmembrane domain-containing protein [Anaerolineae bacterium]
MNIPFKQYWALLAEYIKPQKARFALLAVLVLSNIGVQLVNPQIVRRFIDATQGETGEAALLYAALTFIGLALLQQILAVGATYVGENVAWAATNALRAALVRHCLRLDMGFQTIRHRLRKAELSASTIKIKLRWSDFTTLTRQVTLAESTDQDSVIYETAQRLLKDNWRPGRPARLIGVGAGNLAEPAAQLRLWDTSNGKGQKLQQTLDSLRDRFGRNAIKRAFVMKPPSDASQPSDMGISRSGESP